MQRDGDGGVHRGQHEHRAAPAEVGGEHTGQRQEDAAGEPGHDGDREQRTRPPAGVEADAINIMGLKVDCSVTTPWD